MSHDVIVVGGGHNGLTCAAYEAVPLDPSYATFGPDGKPIFFYDDPARMRAELLLTEGLELLELNPVLVHEQNAMVLDAVALV